MRTSLIEDEPEWPFIHFLLDARNAFEETNYNLTVIYSITALESIVKTFLEFYFEKFPEIRNKVIGWSLNNLISVVLPLVFATDDHKKLLNGLTQSIYLRNQIIHESRLNISKQDAKRSIDAVDEYMKFIMSKFQAGSLQRSAHFVHLSRPLFKKDDIIFCLSSLAKHNAQP